MTEDDFNAWREHPVTKWLAAKFEAAAAAQEAAWRDHSWVQGQADPLMLCELRTRADAYRALSEATFEGLNDSAA